MDLCLWFGRCSLLSRLLLGFQHLGLDVRVMLQDGMTSCRLGVRVEFEHYPQVLQRILLQYSAVDLLVRCAKCLLDLFALQNPAQVCVGHLVHWQVVAGFQGGRFTPGAVQLIQLAEGTLGPDAEASNMTTRGEPQEVQFVHVLQSDAWDISEGFCDTGVLVVDDAWPSALDASAIPHLTLTGTHALGGVHLLDVIPGFKLLQQKHCLLGLLVALNFVFNHQWDLWDFLNAVSLGHHKCRNGRGSQGRADGIALLGCVDPAVPAAPGLSGGKHTTSTTHISKSTLARAVSTTTSHTRDTGHSSSCTPGLCTGLVACQFADCIGLATVLAHVGVNKIHNIRANWSLEHSRHDNIFA